MTQYSTCIEMACYATSPKNLHSCESVKNKVSLFPKPAFRVLEAWGQFSASLSYKLGEPIWVTPVSVWDEYNSKKSRAYGDGTEMRVVIWPRKCQSQKQQSCLSKVSVPTPPCPPNCQTGGRMIFPSWLQRKILFQDFLKGTSSPSWLW